MYHSDGPTEQALSLLATYYLLTAYYFLAAYYLLAAYYPLAAAMFRSWL